VNLASQEHLLMGQSHYPNAKPVHQEQPLSQIAADTVSLAKLVAIRLTPLYVLHALPEPLRVKELLNVPHAQQDTLQRTNTRALAPSVLQELTQ